MTLIATSYLSFLPLVSRMGNDARVLPVAGIDFTIDSGFQLDLTAAVLAAQLVHPVQAMFCDASQVPYGNTAVQIFGTGQQIVVPPLSQGYFPLLLTQNSAVFTFINGSNQGQSGLLAAPFPVFFTNVPFVTQVWSTGAGGSTASGGYGVGPLGSNPLGG